MFKTNNKGFGFGAMPGFNRRKVGSISNGDFDRDGVKNKKDCEPLNWKRQDAKCGWCKENEVESWNKDVGVCEDCLNKRRRENMESTRKQFNEANKSGAMSKQGLMATDWM